MVTNKLQRVMNSAARIVTNTRKFDHGLTHVRHHTLHWLDVPERVTFKLCIRDVHGNGKDWDPMGPMGFPWEWEYDKPWDGSGMGMGIRRMGMGIKTWEWEKSLHTVTSKHLQP